MIKKGGKKAVNRLRNVSKFKTYAGIDLISLPGCLLYLINPEMFQNHPEKVLVPRT